MKTRGAELAVYPVSVTDSHYTYKRLSIRATLLFFSYLFIFTFTIVIVVVVYYSLFRVVYVIGLTSCASHMTSRLLMGLRLSGRIVVYLYVFTTRDLEG